MVDTFGMCGGYGRGVWWIRQECVGYDKGVLWIRQGCLVDTAGVCGGYNRCEVDRTECMVDIRGCGNQLYSKHGLCGGSVN